MDEVITERAQYQFLLQEVVDKNLLDGNVYLPVMDSINRTAMKELKVNPGIGCWRIHVKILPRSAAVFI